MSVFPSPRLDTASQFLMTRSPVVLDDQMASADQLTDDEAAELAAWLKASGYQSIEVLHRANTCSVQWKR